MQETCAYYLADDDATAIFGACLARVLGREGCVVYLQGDLGAGKTTLSRGLIRALGYQGAVKSPTYTLVEPYDFFDFPLYHFDLYRLSDPEEVEFLGVEEYFTPSAVCLIEWPDKGQGFLPAPDMEIRLNMAGRGRCLSVRAISGKGATIAAKLKALVHDAGIEGSP